jgi:hypothetical protein
LPRKFFSVRKIIFHNFLFLFVLLGIACSDFVVVNKQNFDNKSSTSVLQLHKNNPIPFSFYSKTDEKQVKSLFFYEDLELEDDFELEAASFHFNFQYFESTFYKIQRFFKIHIFHINFQNVPLYDLFCNWKHYLS